MTDTDRRILQLLSAIRPINGWRPQHERAFLRARVQQAGANIAEIDRWVSGIGGRIEEYHPNRTLPPYLGQLPLPAATLYIVPRSILDDEPTAA